MAQDNLVKVSAFNLPIPTKHAIEICSFIKGKNINKIKDKLNLVLDEKEIIPLKRFYHKRGHKKGHKGPGFYPKKASKYFLDLLNSLEANAENKGLASENLVIEKAIANYGSVSRHYGRAKHRGTRMKRTHIEIYASPKEISKNKAEEKPKSLENPKQDKK